MSPTEKHKPKANPKDSTARPSAKADDEGNTDDSIGRLENGSPVNPTPSFSAGEKNALRGAAGYIGKAPVEKPGMFKYVSEGVNKRFNTNNSKIKGIGALGISAALSLIFYAIIVSVGPMQFINLSQFLSRVHFTSQERQSETHVGRLIRWARSGDFTQTQMGYLASKYNKKIEARALEKGIVINPSRAGNFNGFTFDPEATYKGDASDSKAKQAHVESEIERLKAAGIKDPLYVHHQVEIDGKTVMRGYIESDPSNAKANIKMLNFIANEQCPTCGKRSVAFQARVLKSRYNLNGMWNPITRVDRYLNTKRNEALAKTWDLIKSLYGPKDAPTAIAVNADKPDPDKTPGAQPAETVQAEAQAAVDEVSKGEAKSANKIGIKAAGLTSVSVAAGGIGLLCAGQTVQDKVEAEKKDVVTKILISMGSTYLSLGSKLTSGDVELDVLSKYSGAINTKGSDGSGGGGGGSWTSANSVQYETNKDTYDGLGAKLSPNSSPIPAKTGLGKFYHSQAYEKSGMRSVCKAANSAPGQVIGISLGVLSGPVMFTFTSGAMLLAMDQLDQALSEKNLAQNLMSEAIPGGVKGESINVANKMLKNTMAINSAWGVNSPAQSGQVAMLDKEYLDAEEKNMSVMEKYASLNNYNSPTSKIVNNIGSSSFAGIVTSLPKGLFNNISSMSIKKTYAAVNATDSASVYYGLEDFGPSEALLSKIDNPYPVVAEAKVLLEGPNGQQLKDRLKKCTGLDVVLEPRLDFTTPPSDDPAAVPDFEKIQEDKDCQQSDVLDDYAKIQIAAYSTSEMKKFVCGERDYNDKESCDDIDPELTGGQQSTVGCGDDGATNSLVEETSDKLYWPVRNQSAINDVNDHDFSVSKGTPVYAIKDGKVTESKELKGCSGDGNCSEGYHSYGKYIKIDHDIKGKEPVVYAHLDKRLVEKGDTVKAGQLIGYSGNTGNTTGPHLHIDFSGSKTATAWLKSQKPEVVPTAKGTGVATSTGCIDGLPNGSTKITDDTENPMPKGEEVAAQAIKWAKNDPRCSFHDGGCANHCLGIVSDLWISAGKGRVEGGTAAQAYQRYKDNGWVNKSKSIPIGAIMWSRGDNPAGHAYTYVGNGLIASNDIEQTGKYSVVSADEITDGSWNHEWLGWSEWHN